MSVTISHEMPLDRVVEEDNRHWYLRTAWLNDGAILVSVRSERAPAGTAAADMKPEAIELTPDEWEGDESLSISVSDLRALMAWPS